MWALSPSFTESPTYPRFSIVPHLSAHYPTSRQHEGSHSRADITPVQPYNCSFTASQSSQGQIHIQLLTPSLHDLTNGRSLPFVIGPVGIVLDGNMNLPCNYGVWTEVVCVCVLVRECRGTIKLEGSRTNQFCARCHLGLSVPWSTTLSASSRPGQGPGL